MKGMEGTRKMTRLARLHGMRKSPAGHVYVTFKAVDAELEVRVEMTQEAASHFKLNDPITVTLERME